MTMSASTPTSRTKNITFNPVSGEGVGNYKLFVRVHGDSYESFYWNIKVDEVRYNEYAWDSIVTEVTPEKYVKVTAQRVESIPYTTGKLVSDVAGETIESSITNNDLTAETGHQLPLFQ